MSGIDTRNISRDSLFLLAEVRLDGNETAFRIKVRNLSTGGMMAEGGPSVERGIPITVELRNIGVVEGIVAWVEEARFGIAFAREIDPKLVRAPTKTNSEGNFPPRFIRTVGVDPHHGRPDPRKLRKI